MFYEKFYGIVSLFDIIFFTKNEQKQSISLYLWNSLFTYTHKHLAKYARFLESFSTTSMRKLLNFIKSHWTSEFVVEVSSKLLRIL